MSLLRLDNLILWIDACSRDGNLLAASGSDRKINIYDRRESRIVRSFGGFHFSKY